MYNLFEILKENLIIFMNTLKEIILILYQSKAVFPCILQNQ